MAFSRAGSIRDHRTLLTLKELSVTLTEQDLRALAARIRPYFDLPLQDIAEEFALIIAHTAGVRVKELRPETTLDEILEWLGPESLDRVETIMAIEEELAFEIPDADAERSSVTTFRQLVLHIARKRGVQS
jgi:acyl carrier protein